MRRAIIRELKAMRKGLRKFELVGLLLQSWALLAAQSGESVELRALSPERVEAPETPL